MCWGCGVLGSFCKGTGSDILFLRTSIEDANSRATTFAYDAFGRLTQTTFPSNLFETYAYDVGSPEAP